LKKSPTSLPDDELTRIKKLAIVAIVADDELLEQLVLKGGNAMDLIYKVSERSSIDLDFSTAGDIDPKVVLPRVQRSLETTFKEAGYRAFDIKMAERPGKMPKELAGFWGGYLLEFKLIQVDRAEAVGYDPDEMSRRAIMFGEKARFTIDISRHEYVKEKREADVDGYTVYVYSPEMIVCEKLRAICQQLPDYGQIVQRSSVGKSRGRDFIDIDLLIEKYGIDVTTEHAHHMLREMFAIKKVPLAYLGRVGEMRDLHAAEFETVKATMRPDVTLQPFDYYFERVLEQCRRLVPLWHE
jgi:predicted nucleotidyltransferase component of viral defense system